MEEIKPGIYRHYKGKEYRVLGTGFHSETLEKMVFYQALYESEDFGKDIFWARPVEMFLESVEIEGKSIPRFLYIRPVDHDEKQLTSA
jgi:hypothetical protein